MRKFMALHRGHQRLFTAAGTQREQMQAISAQTACPRRSTTGTQAFAGMPACFLSSTARV